MALNGLRGMLFNFKARNELLLVCVTLFGHATSTTLLTLLPVCRVYRLMVYLPTLEVYCKYALSAATHCNTLQHTATHCNTLQHNNALRVLLHGVSIYARSIHCNTLHHTVTHCNTQPYTATPCHPMQRTVTHCNTLQHPATHDVYNLVVYLPTLSRYTVNTYILILSHTRASRCCWNTVDTHTGTHCNTLQHTATKCHTLPHTATPCNTLQHAATHCNTLQRPVTHHVYNLVVYLPTLSRYTANTYILILSHTHVRTDAVGTL